MSTWILANNFVYSKNNNTSINFESRNFNIISQKVNPSISFLKNQFSTISTTYTYRNEKNTIGTESLKSNNFGLNYNYNNPEKATILASVNLIENNYNGSNNTPASYKILEGLEAGTNYTWLLTLQKKLTKLLNLSINYNGRKNTSSNAVHIGSVQLRANF